MIDGVRRKIDDMRQTFYKASNANHKASFASDASHDAQSSEALLSEPSPSLSEEQSLDNNGKELSHDDSDTSVDTGSRSSSFSFMKHSPQSSLTSITTSDLQDAIQQAVSANNEKWITKEAALCEKAEHKIAKLKKQLAASKKQGRRLAVRKCLFPRKYNATPNHNEKNTENSSNVEQQDHDVTTHHDPHTGQQGDDDVFSPETNVHAMKEDQCNKNEIRMETEENENCVQACANEDTLTINAGEKTTIAKEDNANPIIAKGETAPSTPISDSLPPVSFSGTLSSVHSTKSFSFSSPELIGLSSIPSPTVEPADPLPGPVFTPPTAIDFAFFHDTTTSLSHTLSFTTPPSPVSTEEIAWPATLTASEPAPAPKLTKKQKKKAKEYEKKKGKARAAGLSEEQKDKKEEKRRERKGRQMAKRAAETAMNMMNILG